MPISDSEISAEIVSIVSAGEIQGSQLAGRLRAKFPDWAPSDTLRSFIARNVPAVVARGRRGMDYVYGLSSAPTHVTGTIASTLANTTAAATAEAASLALKAPPPKNLWRIWVSPSGRFDLQVESTSADVAAVSRNDASPSGWIRVLPATVDDHRRIAMAFCAQLPDTALRAELESLTRNERWWELWEVPLKAAHRRDEWLEFRRVELLGLLKKTLLGVGLALEVVERVATQVVGRGPKARTVRTAGASQLRDLALRVVQSMRDEDLRSIHFPLGAVFDALKSK